MSEPKAQAGQSDTPAPPGVTITMHVSEASVLLAALLRLAQYDGAESPGPYTEAGVMRSVRETLTNALRKWPE